MYGYCQVLGWYFILKILTWLPKLITNIQRCVLIA